MTRMPWRWPPTQREGGGKITALTVGAAEAQGALKSAMGWVWTLGPRERPGCGGHDSFGIASILAAAVRKLAPWTSFCRCVPGIPEVRSWPRFWPRVGWPALTFVSRIEARDGTVRVRGSSRTLRDLAAALPWWRDHQRRHNVPATPS